MTRKAERLARELVELSQRYTDSEFEEANDIIRSGRMFAPILALATATRALRPRKTRTPSRSAPSRSTSLDLALSLPDDERSQLAVFQTRIEAGEVLPSGAAIHAYARELGVSLPTKVSRRQAAARLAAAMADLAPEVRRIVIDRAERPNATSSSLKRWSELIVKNDDEGN